MVRLLKIFARILGIIAIFILLFWIGLAVYVNNHKKELLSSITNQLNASINGTLSAEHIEPTLIKGFPSISVVLNNVVLHDTMYPVHHHNLLEAKKLSIAVNVFSFLTGNTTVENVRIQDANIYLFTDSLGYSNTNLFHKKGSSDSSAKTPQLQLNHFYCDNVHFIFEQKAQKKFFNFDIANLEGKINYDHKDWHAFVKMNALIKALTFYTPAGSFLENRRVNTHFELDYNDAGKCLNMPVKPISIEGNRVLFGASFFMDHVPIRYKIEAKADNIDYQLGRSWLSAHIQHEMRIVDVKKPLNVQATIKGTFERGNQPLVYVRWQARNNILEVQGNTIKDCAFNGYFYNQIYPEVPVCDENSAIGMTSFKGNWASIGFKADTVQILNLISPVMTGHFRSDFELNQLSNVLHNNSFVFDKGHMNLDIFFKGGIDNNDTTVPYIIGHAQLSNGSVIYTPRQLGCNNISAEFNFTGSSLSVKNMQLQNGTNLLFMEGYLYHLLSLYYTAPDKMVLDWHIRSPYINLAEYKKFIVSRDQTNTANRSVKTSESKSVRRFSDQLDEVFERSNVNIQLDVAKIGYQKFVATNIAARLKLTETSVHMEQVSLQHAGGTIQFSGAIDQNSTLHHFSLHTQVDRVRVNEFLTAFGNFGQTTLTEQNIKGEFYMRANLSGAITDNGQLVPTSINGIANIELKHGALIEFQPLKNIGKFIFRRRNLAYVNIGNISDQFDINGELIRIHPLKLSSDIINADIEGLYSFGKGTDINIDVPLRNPKNDELILDDSVKLEKRNKGLLLHLNVIDVANGTKIRLVGKRHKIHDVPGAQKTNE